MTSEATTAVADGRKITFGYERSVNVAPYETEKVSLFMTDVVPEGVSVVQFMESASPAAIDQLKMSAWSALGLDFSIDEAGTPVLSQPVNVEAQHRAAPPTAPPGGFTPPSQAPQQTFAPPPIQQNQRGSDNPAVAQPGYYADPPGFCKDCGNREFYDNRADVDQRIQQGQKIGPDFKCKQCKKGVFRPGSYDYNQSLAGAPMAHAQTHGEAYDRVANAPSQMPPTTQGYDPERDGAPF